MFDPHEEGSIQRHLPVSDEKLWDEKLQQEAIDRGLDPILYSLFVRCLTKMIVSDIVGPKTT